MSNIPLTADVVIIGCSIAYHLTKLSTEDLPAEAGLAFTCAWDKPGGCIDRDIPIRQFGSDKRPNKRLLQFKLCDSNELLFHEEPVLVDGRAVGLITSGRFGHRIDASLGMGYVQLNQPVTTELLRHTRFEVGVGDRRVSAEARLGAWYGPANERIKH